jgi:hypothetical protein
MSDSSPLDDFFREVAKYLSQAGPNPTICSDSVRMTEKEPNKSKLKENPFDFFQHDPKYFSKMSIEELSALASSDDINAFYLDGFNEEASPFISVILQKAEIIYIDFDSPKISDLLSTITSIRATTLSLAFEYPKLPMMPRLSNLMLNNSGGFTNLAKHIKNFKTISFLSIFNVKSVILHENTREYEDLTQIYIERCHLVDLEKFYSKNLERIDVQYFHKITTRKVILDFVRYYLTELVEIKSEQFESWAVLKPETKNEKIMELKPIFVIPLL